MVSSAASPTGAAGGDLSGSYPNPVVAQVNGAALPLGIANGGTAAATAAAAATSLGFMRKLLDLGTSGVALANSTGALGGTFTTPNDGNLHPIIFVATLVVATTNETGGATGITFTDPAGNVNTNFQLLAGAQTVGTHLWSFAMVLAKANTVINFAQTSALTAGGPATLYGQAFGL